MLMIAITATLLVPQEGALEQLEEARRAMERAESLLDESRIPEAESQEKDAIERLKRVLESAIAPDPGRSVAALRRVLKEVERPSKFALPRARSGSWGRLPPELLRSMLAAAADDVPAPFREYWRRYFLMLLEAAGRP